MRRRAMLGVGLAVLAATLAPAPATAAHPCSAGGECCDVAHRSCGPIPAAAGGRTTRVFAVGPKLDLGWMQTRETYRDKMFGLVDRRLRGPGKPLIQEGADDVASHLLGPTDPARPAATARDLVNFPEDIGLFSALTGPRGAAARSGGSLEAAFVILIGDYAPQNAYYAQRFPGLAERVPPIRLLGLALTDTFARVAVETFSEMADRYDVYLHAGVNMAQDWRVVCTNREAFNAARPPRLPGGVQCSEQSPEKVVLLRDPQEPARDYAYEAVSPKASNMALVFDPDGKLISKQVKTYITPTELPGQLDLVPGEVSDGLSALRTPVGTLGFVTSKDAWMPDLMQKLDQRHVDLLVQPEFFVNDIVCSRNCPRTLTSPGTPGQFAPDTLRASGYNDVLRHPSIETLVLPEVTGNIFNFSADAQQHIAVKPRQLTGGSYLVGQPPGPGLVQAMPWVVPDPVRPDEPFAERRRRLAAAGDALAPGSGVPCPDPARPGPCENGHVEGVLFRDVEVGRAPRYRRFGGPLSPTRFSPARPVRPSTGAQRNAATALRGAQGVLAFEERSGGRDQILLVRTADGGRTWSRPVRPTGRPAGATDEWWPAVALGDRGRVTVAWVDRSSGRERVYFSRSTDGGARFGPAGALDPSAPRGAAQWRPALAQGSGDLVHAAFVDERARSSDDDLPQAGLYFARIRSGAAEKARRLDGGQPASLAAKLDHSWAPSVAARGDRVLVSWLDFLRYDWDVFARLSRDAGATFGPQADVNDTPEDDPATSEGEQDEALNDTPRAALGARTPFVAWTDWRKRDETQTVPHSAYDIFVATPGGANRQVDPYGARQVSTFSPAVCPGEGDDMLVAFQDASQGQNDIRLVRMAGGTRRTAAERVDDAGPRGGNAWRPQLACSGRRLLVAWEDERDGPPQIYAAARGGPRPAQRPRPRPRRPDGSRRPAFTG